LLGNFRKTLPSAAQMAKILPTHCIETSSSGITLCERQKHGWGGEEEIIECSSSDLYSLRSSRWFLQCVVHYLVIIRSPCQYALPFSNTDCTLAALQQWIA
jgi:hypothetical protein